MYLAKYKQHVLSHRIVANGDSQFVSFSSIYLPFKESKPDTNLYDNSKLLNNNRLPIAEDYEQWFDATDFTLFPDQKYTYEDFAKEIEEKNNIFYAVTADSFSALRFGSQTQSTEKQYGNADYNH